MNISYKEHCEHEILFHFEVLVDSCPEYDCPNLCKEEYPIPELCKRCWIQHLFGAQVMEVDKTDGMESN